MKNLISFALAFAILAAAPGMALAGNKGNKPFGGKVSAVDTTANTITVTKKKQGMDRTFKTADAKVTVDGVAGKLSDITVGMHAKITVGSAPDTASAIDATTHKKGGQNHKKSGKNAAPAAAPAPSSPQAPAK